MLNHCLTIMLVTSLLLDKIPDRNTLWKKLILAQNFIPWWGQNPGRNTRQKLFKFQQVREQRTQLEPDVYTIFKAYPLQPISASGPKSFRTSQNSNTSWRLSIETYECVRDISHSNHNSHISFALQCLKKCWQSITIWCRLS